MTAGLDPRELGPGSGVGGMDKPIPDGMISRNSKKFFSKKDLETTQPLGWWDCEIICSVKDIQDKDGVHDIGDLDDHGRSLPALPLPQKATSASIVIVQIQRQIEYAHHQPAKHDDFRFTAIGQPHTGNEASEENRPGIPATAR